MACLQVCQRVCSTASSHFWPLRNSSSAYQAMHRSCQQSVTVIRFIGLVIFSVTLLDDLQMPARPGTNITSSGSGHRFPQSPVAHTCVLPINTNCSSPPMSTSTFGPRAFCSSGPLSWNVLPSQLRDPAISINIFRQSLKTYLFNNYSDYSYILFS